MLIVFICSVHRTAARDNIDAGLVNVPPHPRRLLVPTMTYAKLQCFSRLANVVLGEKAAAATAAVAAVVAAGALAAAAAVTAAAAAVQAKNKLLEFARI